MSNPAKAVGLQPKAMPAAPAAPEKTAEELAAEQRQRDEAERVKATEEARAQQEREAFANRMRGRAAFLSEAGEAGYRLGGV